MTPIPQELHDLLTQATILAQDSTISDNVLFFEEIVFTLGASKNPSVIRPLLLLLSDSCPEPEVMYTILHEVEAFPLTIYIDRALDALPDLARRSPEWAGRLLLRIVNSPQGSTHIASLLSQRPALRELVSPIANDLISHTPAAAANLQKAGIIST